MRQGRILSSVAGFDFLPKVYVLGFEGFKVKAWEQDSVVETVNNVCLGTHHMHMHAFCAWPVQTRKIYVSLQILIYITIFGCFFRPICDRIKMGLNFVILFLYDFGSIIGICVGFNKSKRSLAKIQRRFDLHCSQVVRFF